MKNPRIRRFGRTASAAVVGGLLLAACSSVVGAPPTVALPEQYSSEQVANGSESAHYKILYAFDADQNVAAHPIGVTTDAEGDVFGATTEYKYDYEAPVLFELSRAGHSYVERVLFDFDCATTGCYPQSAPVLDRETKDIFITNSSGGPQFGTVVRLRKQSSGSYGLAALFGFIEDQSGTEPGGNVIIEGDTLYAMACCNANDSGGAAIVALDRTTLQGSVVYEFSGATSFCQLATDGTGALYGTTFAGGSASAGTVFKFVPSGSGGTETDLYTFRGGSDGQYPVGPLAFDKSGNIYGTTQNGGGASDDGIVFKLTRNTQRYSESILHAFRGPPDGAYPDAGLVIDENLLWGDTLDGGDPKCNCGTLFSLSKNGDDYQIRHAFRGTDGAYPETTLAKRERALYGATPVGGPYSNPGGVVFRYTP